MRTPEDDALVGLALALLAVDAALIIEQFLSVHVSRRADAQMPSIAD